MTYDKRDHDRDIYKMAGDAIWAIMPYLFLAFLVTGGAVLANKMGWF